MTNLPGTGKASAPSGISKTQLDSKLALANRETARRSPAGLAQVVTGGRWKPHPHLRLLNHHLMRAARGEVRRLMVFMPPQHGKSTLCSQYFPSWYVGRNPHKRMILASYEASFAASWGRRVRDVLEEYGNEFFGINIRQDSSARDNWNLDVPEPQGGMSTAGIGGPVTGKTANCVLGDTLVQTDLGKLRIDYLYYARITCNILTYDPSAGLSWQPLQAVRRLKASRLIRITTCSGRVIEATPEHRFYVDGQYRMASELSAGDRLLRYVQSGNRETCVSSPEGTPPWMQEVFLLPQMPVGPEKPEITKNPPMPEMRGRDFQELVDVVRKVRPSSWQEEAASASGNDLPHVQRRIYGELEGEIHREVCHLLQQGMCGEGTLQAYERGEQPQMEARMHSAQAAAPFSKSISSDSPIDSRERWASLRGVQKFETVARPSYRRMAHEQRRQKSSEPLQFMPSSLAQREGFEAVEDSVALVEPIRDEAFVYDIQVDKNHNFFANGILVHNCLLIDDPIKNAVEAMSETIRERNYEWFFSAALTRVSEDGIIILIQTRWAEDDLAGRLIADMQTKGEKWEIVNLPAIAENDEDWATGWKRKRGEGLCPPLFSLSTLETRKSAMSEYLWSALYQQRPIPIGGAIFKSTYFENRWRPSEKQPGYLSIQDGLYSFDPMRMLRFVTVDTALTEEEIGVKKAEDPDYTSIGIWLTFPTPSGSMLLLLDRRKGRWSAPQIIDELKEVDSEWTPAFAAIESKAGGQATYQMAKAAGLKVREIKPLSRKPKEKDDHYFLAMEGSKTARAMVAAQPLMHQKRFFLPEAAPWLPEYLNEMLSFPLGKHDDDVDMTVYACAIADKYAGAPVSGNGEAKAGKGETRDDGRRNGNPDGQPNPLDRFFGSKPAGL